MSSSKPLRAASATAAAITAAATTTAASATAAAPTAARAPRAARARPWRLGAVLLAGCALLSAGCANRRLQTLNAAQLYRLAHKQMVENDTTNAAKTYESLTSRFPFTDQARQGRLDLIYVYYRKGDKDSAVDAADDFLREEPTNSRDDYAWYMKGLIYFERVPFSLERFLGVDMARKPPVDILKSITAFNTVVTMYPNSVYAHDALRRMTYLRNRLAQYDIYVARYYVRRGAYLAAAQRANEVLDQYEGAPAQQDALRILLQCYRKLGLNQLAANVQRMYAFNYPPGSPIYTTPKRHWWQF
ncbi:MAG TPA: outer membrane protein assembly factor BamD [Steroidobacteraceae bacterium]|nr:outer membrane protein assembly factor BamD [Steroidobacteraceae bacterium]